MDGRKRIKIGNLYQVNQFGGLDSGRIGRAVTPSIDLVRETAGWYGPVHFTGPLAVVLLQDERGYFAPFRVCIQPI